MEIPVPTKREVIEEIKKDPDFYRYLKDDAQRNDPDILDALLEGIKTMSGDRKSFFTGENLRTRMKIPYGFLNSDKFLTTAASVTGFGYADIKATGKMELVTDELIYSTIETFKDVKRRGEALGLDVLLVFQTIPERLNEDMAFEFTLKEGENVIQTVTAANGTVLFDPIIYTSAGTHVYTIVENWETYSGPLDASGVTFDTHVETVTVEVTDDGEGKLSAEVTYDADGPAFANRTNPGDLIITKNVIGQTAANADDTFTFTIRIKSPTGGDINSASIEIGKLPTAEQSPEPTP